MADAGAFLWPVRDPIDRLVSAFYFQHSKNNPGGCPRERYMEHVLLFCHCFTHITDLVAQLEISNVNDTKHFVHPVTNQTTSCQDVARQALTERHTKRWGHFSMNYQYYHDRTIGKFPHKDVVVVRTEHLWHDLQQVEYWMGGNATVGPETRGVVSHGSEQFALKGQLTDPQQVQLLCCVVQAEVRLYVQILQRAVNLKQGEKQESIQALAQRCNLDLCATNPETTGGR